jgi:hypothetical protein
VLSAAKWGYTVQKYSVAVLITFAVSLGQLFRWRRTALRAPNPIPIPVRVHISVLDSSQREDLKWLHDKKVHLTRGYPRRQ